MYLFILYYINNLIVLLTKMDLKKYNYIQTSPNSKINNDDYKNRFNLFNYRLFNANEENIKLNIK